MNRRTLMSSICAGVLALTSLGAGVAVAQSADWPQRSVRLVVPFPAGGSTDSVARLLAERLTQSLGQTVIVDNRPGAGGNIGTDNVAKSAPDGYTLALSTSGPLANNPFLYKNMPFDPNADLTPVALVGVIPLVVATSDASPAKNLQEFIAQAKAAPGTVAIGNPGNGTIGHLAERLFSHSNDLDVIPVAYRGDTPLMTDLMGGSVQAVVAPITAFLPQIASGRVKGLAVTTKERFVGAPDVPTAAEQGVDLEAAVWFAIVGPKGMPQPIVERLNQEINAVLASEEGKAKLLQAGAQPGSGGPEALGELMQAEAAKWQTVIKNANITLD